MTEHIIWVTVWMNRLLGKPAAALLAALHIHSDNPQYPIPTYVCMQVLIVLLCVLFFLWLRTRISVENPGVSQQLMEGLLENPMGIGARDLLRENIPHDADRYLPMVGSLGIFILVANLISIVPSLDSPTAEKSVPLGCAIVVFLYYNFQGIRHHGAPKYGKHFLGPILPMSPIMLPVEIFSHSFRLLSLTARLWANMFVSELLYGVFLGLTVGIFVFLGKLSGIGYISAVLPLAIPPIFILLHVFVAFVQAFVFTILPVIYLSGAVGEEH
jgi:F-type H+-transporting ATPase subunit a